ncbi:Nucleoredoxin [Papilio machaon]|uniref:Nucleoredoxin n=1 Tax=Papilio machaon TaxID=76193 RepID=A0A194RSA9_PAPMA|nr:Nucleoredoxin [Papilio machaon]
MADLYVTTPHIPTSHFSYCIMNCVRRLTQKYSIAVGVPTLVIRGRPVRDALLNDPGGERFPWPAPPLHDVLRGVQLQGEAGSKLFEELPGDTVRVFYFAAHWCPPCRTFAPSLCNALAAVRKRRAKYANTQLILVSSDRVTSKVKELSLGPCSSNNGTSKAPTIDYLKLANKGNGNVQPA